ncbi:antA/AntB antirepressor family protein [Enterobacter ludwigii]|uniref:antA/AntB antirepressor family protein n=1 Tax=Enterobacter ludwigii TaxID=299767 RepID=UPI003BEED577
MKKSNAPHGESLAHSEFQNGINFAELIPVTMSNIGGKETQSVSSRKLYVFLAVGRDYTTWIKSRIEKYKFVEGVDYVIVENLTSPKRGSSKSRQRTEHDYILSLNMGKELSMVENSNKGRAVRRYFIQCEEELQRQAPEKAAALRRELKARLTAASYFKPMCVALEAYRADKGKTTQQRHYTTESNLLARIVLDGMTAKQWAKENGITGNPRDHLNAVQLEHLSYLEQTNITLIELGQDYHQRKVELMRLSQRWLVKRLEAENA